jgi:dCTP deaminase
MIVNGQTLFDLAPIKDMDRVKKTGHGVSYGMSEAGYDIRIKQDIHFKRIENPWSLMVSIDGGGFKISRFTLASAIEEFQMPPNLVGIVHDKSTWARRGLSVFNTVIEPSWKGFLTLELVYHGNEDLIIPAGSGIAQVVFHKTSDDAYYGGKYQDQEDRPVEARESIS